MQSYIFQKGIISGAPSGPPPPQLPRVPVSPQKIIDIIQNPPASTASAAAKNLATLPASSSGETADNKQAVSKSLSLSSSNATALVAGAPIYMVASPSSASGSPSGAVRVITSSAPGVTPSGGQRVVTVSTAALRAVQQGAAAGGIPGQKTTTVYRTLSAPGGGQRAFVTTGAAAGGGAGGTSRPSVIVVQRTPMSSKAPGAGANIVLSPAPGVQPPAGQRMLTKNGKPLVNQHGQPIFIMQNPAGSNQVLAAAPAPRDASIPEQPVRQIIVPSSTTTEAKTTADSTDARLPDSTSPDKASSTATPKGNVLVLGVNQQQDFATRSNSSGGGTNVLSDILHATGIIQEDQQEQQQDQESMETQEEEAPTITYDDQTEAAAPMEVASTVDVVPTDTADEPPNG